uniref:Putative nuclear pore complex protein NUP1 isoform X1 n=1 Tax=Davidia involucrata TaxID=16924 RepID=A0A5B7CA51_DAVIN
MLKLTEYTFFTLSLSYSGSLSLSILSNLIDGERTSGTVIVGTLWRRERGAGGKFRKPLARKLPATPYDRPPRNQSQTAAQWCDGGWLSKLAVVASSSSSIPLSILCWTRASSKMAKRREQRQTRVVGNFRHFVQVVSKDIKFLKKQINKSIDWANENETCI